MLTGWYDKKLNVFIIKLVKSGRFCMCSKNTAIRTTQMFEAVFVNMLG